MRQKTKGWCGVIEEKEKCLRWSGLMVLGSWFRDDGEEDGEGASQQLHHKLLSPSHRCKKKF